MTADHELEERLAALMTVQNTAQELMSELDPYQLLHKIVDAAVEVLNATTGSLLVWAPPNELEFAVSKDARLIGKRMPADKGISGWVFTHEQPLTVPDVAKDPRHFQEVDRWVDFRTHSLLVVPLMTPTERIGVLEVLNKRSGEPFDDHDQDLLGALGAQAAQAIVNARLYQELQEEKDRILVVEDQMHKKLARDLHDGPAQTLAAMIMDIEFILKLYERAPDRVPGELSELRESATKALAQVRNAMFELRPVVLETQGLKAALESYVERLISTEGMDLFLDLRNLEGRLPPKVEEQCFAIVHEAVGNVRKHTNGAKVWIIVERRPKDLVVAVRDNGKGFDVEQVERNYDQSGSLGLLNIRERSEALGARCSIQSTLGRGTLVSLIVPLSGTGDVPGEPAHKASALAGREHRQQVDGSFILSESDPAQVRVPIKRRKGTGPLEWFGHETESGPASKAPKP